ncbi:MAG: MotA/TolQ/ExbB proton channel family protein [Lachnospiraceae bacterium]|nr:MotA/TolQ/ExbB proton channel family protein [Lachnospiraceae bacterium]
MKSNSGGSILLGTYFLMLAVCVGLNIKGGFGADLVNIAVNAVMFVIVGFIILWSNMQCLSPVGKMTTSLYYTIRRMEFDFNKSGAYLWEDYRDELDLFRNKILNQRFNEYRLERKRLNLLSEHGVKCDIEDYINEYLVDMQIKKGLVGIIPGVMTGLGILGTFVGLAFGLQNFDTASAETITNSIAPLMDGIKIAFHTSIYGMVFSLIYNFVYKKILEDAYRGVDRFLESYHKYVLPKTDNDDLGVMLAVQEKQLKQMENLLDSFGDQLAVKIVEAMNSPYLRNDTMPDQ